MTLEQQIHQYELSRAYYDCENTAGRLFYYTSTFMMRDVMALWSTRDDCCLEMPFGCYIGPAGVRRYYTEVLGDRNDPQSLERLLGVMCVSTLDTPVIEVASDLKTARGIWFSPGFETYGEAAKYQSFQGHGFWMWAKVAIDFLLEDGVWKLWHVRIHQVFRTEYHTSWTEVKEYLGYPLGDARCDAPPRSPFRPYNIDEIPDAGPEIPRPYESFDQVYPGYGMDGGRENNR